MRYRLFVIILVIPSLLLVWGCPLVYRFPVKAYDPDLTLRPTPEATPDPGVILEYNEGTPGYHSFGWDGSSNTGCGQSVTFDFDCIIKSVSFYFSGPETLVDATYRLVVWDLSGYNYMSAGLNVSRSFKGGAVTWSGLDISISAGETRVFATYVDDVSASNQYRTSIMGINGGSCPYGNGYISGIDSEMENWPWSIHEWDFLFRLEGERLY